ncbi:endonuclease MutS2 [Peribacillus kribbensis]|uniref:endonuclease MutS2 n=1 Tax=Peribacillus kribbensis TaxID=356658 RepID=UPI0004178653|nr:DNA mismatch repair protein [Peribacillus kribbensis]
MNEKTFDLLGFTRIKEEAAQYAMSEEAKEKVRRLVPSYNKKQIEAWLQEITEGVAILEKSSSVPLTSMGGIYRLLEGLNKGVSLREDQLSKLYDFLDSCEKLKRFMKGKQFLAPRVASYSEAIEDISDLAKEIQRCIRNGRVDDHASRALTKVRRLIAAQQEKIKEKLLSIVRSNKYKTYLQDQNVSERNGRYVISVKREYRNKIKGEVLDTSASGSTVFMEPSDLQYLQEEWSILKSQEEVEVEEILQVLTGLVERHEREIIQAAETMIHYDVLFAKARYSRAISGNEVMVSEEKWIFLKQATHPLIGPDAVPLDIELGRGTNVLVITGPNTGGKTVALKTVGLLTLMAQSGFHVPAVSSSVLPIFHKVLIDIGDGQSIEQSLSTFSSHIKSVIEILKEANDRSLVLMDELGSGTDPGEGMGLAAMILNQLHSKGAYVIATTHYSEIKDTAYKQEGFINGSMEFDLDTLKPTYRLLIGQGGESQAFTIALKLGMHPKLIEMAHKITYKDEKKYSVEAPDDRLKKDWEKQIAVNKHRGKELQQKALGHATHYEMGDNVLIVSTGEYGIVCKGPDSLGNYTIQVKGEKRSVNHKRIKLYIKSEELYPEDYDFRIIFDSKENRKAEQLMEKKHVEGLIINRELGK